MEAVDEVRSLMELMAEICEKLMLEEQMTLREAIEEAFEIMDAAVDMSA